MNTALCHPPDASGKPAAREALKTALRATAPDERATWSAAIHAHLLLSAYWSQARTVMIFAALRYEPDLLPLLDAAEGRRLVFPAMEDGRIQPRLVRAAAEMSVAPGGIREPAGCPPVLPGEIDLILVPGLGFTPGGVRLGRGRGDYDRFLPGLRVDVPRVGTAFGCQVCDALPAEPLDVPMSAILTENGLLLVLL